MSSFITINEEDLDSGLELTPEDVEKHDASCEIKELGKVSSDYPSKPFYVSNGKLCNQDFYELRASCLESGKLFDDPEFPPDDQSLYFSKTTNYEWKRASKLSDNPKLFEGGTSRFDINQGELGDCWLLAATANLAMNKKLLYKVVPKDQSFTEDYAGIFHFKFWQYGEWVDVVIDDYLPTNKSGCSCCPRLGNYLKPILKFGRSDTNNEFWTALLEKAYAKLHGSYEALDLGFVHEAHVDFTGGCSQIFVRNSSGNFSKEIFTLMSKSYKHQSMMSCAMIPDPNVKEAIMNVGLVKGHAYSITKVLKAKIETPKVSGEIPLVRIRNPWGGKVEWTGAWSDRSAEWNSISDDEKKNMGLYFENDGEFWMSYEDFQKYWDILDICHLSPDAFDDSYALQDDTTSTDGLKWHVKTVEGSWIPGQSAGGCSNYIDTFAMNPQFRISVQDPDEYDGDNLCTLIISLMQKGRRALREEGLKNLPIGFDLYYLRNPDSLPKPLNTDFFRAIRSVGSSGKFTYYREVTCGFRLPPGTYCIVPSTFKPDEAGDFFIRIFSEKANNVEI